MKRLLIVAFFILAMAVQASALECPDPTETIYDDGAGHYSFEYSCDNGVRTRIIKMTPTTTDREIIEFSTGKKCVEFRGTIICFDRE